MQKTEKPARIRDTAIFGFPVQMRTLLSRSYFFMTASTSSELPVSAAAGCFLFSSNSCFAIRLSPLRRRNPPLLNTKV